MLEHFQEKSKKLEREVRDRTLTYIIGGFGFVAGLAWNDAIKTLIEALFPLQRDFIWVKFLYAAVVTLFVVAGSLVLARFMGKGNGNGDSP